MDLAQSECLLLLAQNNNPAYDAGYQAGYAIGQLLFCCCIPLLGIVFFAFWLWMLIDCCTKTFPGENEKTVWILVIALTGAIGALIYFFVGRPKGTPG